MLESCYLDESGRTLQHAGISSAGSEAMFGLFKRNLVQRGEHAQEFQPMDEETRPNAKLRLYTAAALAAGLLCVSLFSANVPQGQSFLERIGASFSLSLGAVVLGSLLGFVFGIPRTPQHDTAPSPNPNANATAAEQESIGYQINTNLEQISDWLTKIIVGVGLVQLGSIGRWLMTFSATVGAGFGSTQLGQTYVLGVVLYFSGAGFLLGYLWTRLSFGLAVKEADKGLVERRIEKFEADIRADTVAVSLVTRQLSSAQDDTRISQQELQDAVVRATRTTKVKLFYDAVAARKDNERIDQSIQVFQALIAADKNKAFHRNWGQLGYALKDKSAPDWEAAEKAFTEAIAIRDRLGETDYGSYEYNRAVCRVRLKKPTDSIVEDLKAAAKDKYVREWEFDPQTSQWLKENDFTRAGLGFT